LQVRSYSAIETVTTESLNKGGVVSHGKVGDSNNGGGEI
jgi:hypothetical protein